MGIAEVEGYEECIQWVNDHVHEIVEWTRSENPTIKTAAKGVVDTHVLLSRHWDVPSATFFVCHTRDLREAVQTFAKDES